MVVVSSKGSVFGRRWIQPPKNRRLFFSQRPNVLAGNSGAFSITGGSATLGRGRFITAESGTYSYARNVGHGEYSISGSSTTYRKGSLISAASGSRSISGTAATLTYAAGGSGVNVSGVSGTVSEGSTITISGSNFGSSGPSVLLFDNFESGTNGNAINTGAGSATVGQWDSISGVRIPRYYNGDSHSGSKCMRADMTDYWLEYIGVDTPGAGVDDVFMSYWFKLPSGDAFPGGTSSPNWKVVWVTGGDSSTNAITIPTGLASDGSNWVLACNGCPISPNISLGDLDWVQGTWQNFRFFVQAASDSSGRLDFWHLGGSGIVHDAAEDLATVTSSGDKFTTIHVNGFGNQDSNCHPQFDDIYIATGSNCLARAEIGNAATYDACTNLAICPTTSWSSSSIAATVRKGSFGTGGAYLYVHDANDNVNSSGFSITLS